MVSASLPDDGEQHSFRPMTISILFMLFASPEPKEFSFCARARLFDRAIPDSILIGHPRVHTPVLPASKN